MDPRAEHTKQAVEIRFDEAGNVLKVEPWPFKRMHGKGENFIENYKEYLVVDSAATFGKHGGVMLEHIVRLIADRTPCFSTIERLVRHLESDGQITNGPQSISFANGHGYLSCDNPDCCYRDFESIEEVKKYILLGLDTWEIVPKKIQR